MVEASLQQETQHLSDDSQRDHAQLDQTRDALDSAYDADLALQIELKSDWVRDATRVYVAAREELLRHELRLEDQRRVRIQNLRSGVMAQRRAVEILERQNQLIVQTLGIDLWRLGQATSTIGTQPAIQSLIIKETP